MWKVTYASDYMDTNPTIKTFDVWYELEDWINEEVQHRVQWTVDHSPYSISEEERSQIEEVEYSLVNIQNIKENQNV